jgi:glycosyltransferase involved in cell wall biosynthesis
LAKLLIISGMEHGVRNGQVVGHGPTAREVSQLATRFERVHHVAYFDPAATSALMLPYSSENVRLIPVPAAGGDGLLQKAGVLVVAGQYIRTIMHELRELDPESDVVHVRCPAPISLVALILMSIAPSPRKRWVKYAGNWQPMDLDSTGYAVQRWWLKRNFARAKVTVNGHWPNQPHHIAAFTNPCLSCEELAEIRAANAAKPPLKPLRLIFIGSVNARKGVGRALEIVQRLINLGLDLTFDIVGDGPERGDFEAKMSLALQSRVTFHGWVPRTVVGSFLMPAHLMLLPSDSEGWPKVLSEGMAYGVVPVASDISSIPQYLSECGVGATLNPDNIEGFVAAILNYTRHPEQWQRESIRGLKAAKRFTYEVYLENVCRLLELDDRDQPRISSS